MNYMKHYNSLIEKAQNREISGYKELHHIIPKCMGGSDSKDNLVALTAREHFIAHKLLTKIYPDNSKLWFAFSCMSRGRKVSSIQYEDTMKARSIAMTMNNPSKNGAWNKGLKLKKSLRKTELTEAERNMHSERMKSQNPMTLYPEKNHTARPIIVEYMDGTIEEYSYAKQFADKNNIPYVTVKYWIQKGKGSKKYNVKSVKKVL